MGIDGRVPMCCVLEFIGSLGFIVFVARVPLIL